MDRSRIEFTFSFDDFSRKRSPKRGFVPRDGRLVHRERTEAEGLFVGRFGSAGHVSVAEVMQHGSFLVGHATGEVRIVQALITRGFRHILQDAELLFHHLLAVPRHLAPARKYVILDVVALLRREIPPGLLALAKVGALLRRHVIPLIELLPDLVLLIWRKILERATALQHVFALARG
jgi:hypothetical protein